MWIGAELDRLAGDILQIEDGYSDTYWEGTVTAINVVPGPPGHIEVTYTIPELLGASQLKIGKTLVVQENDGYGSIKDFGRFLIKDIVFDPCNCGSTETNIVVYDALHDTGVSPGTYSALALNSTARLYFGYDSVSFNTESAYDNSAVGPFKRYFEVFVDQNRKTFTHERARLASDGANITVNRSYCKKV